MKDIVHYLEKVHKTKPNKRTRDSSTAFLDPYEHIDFKPLFENLRDRWVKQMTKTTLFTLLKFYSAFPHFRVYFQEIIIKEEEIINLVQSSSYSRGLA